MDTAQALIQLAKDDKEKINTLGRASTSTSLLHGALLERPIASAGWLATKTGLSPATTNKCLSHLEALGIVSEITARKRNRLFSYVQYIEIMNRGLELPE